MANPDLCLSGAPVAAATGVALFTTSPSAVTLASGGSASYTVGGGTGAYTATSGNTGVVTTSLAGATLTINSISQGAAPIVIVDSIGKTVTINVTVLAKGQTGIPPSIFPASITVGDCTTNIPFVFTGGTAPFTIFTSDNFGVPVSAALPIGPNSYFMASVGPLATISSSSATFKPYPGTATVTVLDSQSRTATASIIVGVVHDTCPANPLLKIVSASQNAHATEILAFQIIGGVAPFTVVSRDTAVATVAAAVSKGDGTSSFNATAISTGTSLLTVISADKQQANIVFTVYPTPVLP